MKMKKAIILLANGFEEIEAVTVIDILRRADVRCDMCSIESGDMVTGSHNISIKADQHLADLLAAGYEALARKYDAVILPGGMPGSANLRDNEKVVETVKEFFKQGKIVAAICAAPIVLERAGLLKNRRVTSYPGSLLDEKSCNYTGEMVTKDGNLITGRAPGAAAEFAYTILDALGLVDRADSLRKGMFFTK